jgi:serine phosphatase RsbU (regulator of sigma subunit)
VAGQRRSTKVPKAGAAPAPGPAATPGKAAAAATPPRPKATPAQPEPQKAPDPAPVKRKSSKGTRRSSGIHEAAVPEAGQKSANAPRGADSIGALRRRGMSLAFKFSLFTLLVICLVTFLFGLFSIRDLRTHMLDEITRSGYQDVLVLQAFGRRVISEVRGDGANFNLENLKNYEKTNKESDQHHLEAIKNSDPRIVDVAIFASSEPTDNPTTVLVSATKIDNFSPGTLVDVNLPDANTKVLVFRRDYGGKPCLYFRLPLVEATGTKMYASADIILSAEAIDAEVGKQTRNLIIVGLVFIGAGVGLSLALGMKIVQPITGLVDDLKIVAEGDLEHESAVPNETNDEIGLLAMAFNRMTKSLRDAREMERESERLTSELNTAQAIHAQLLPKKRPDLPGFDIDTLYNCAKEVGGDYYDFIPVGDAEHLAFVVADVSGKGIPGSMVMGQMRTVIRMMAVNNLSAAEVLAKTNYHVARDIKRGMFVTCMYAIMNLRTREMTIASAGHNPMLIWRAATGKIEKVRPSGIALGFDKGPVFNRTVREQKLRVMKGDRIVLYTDGVVEAMNLEREEWGDEALDAFTIKYATVPSNEYVRLLSKALDDHKGRAEQHDDITVLTFRIT